LMCSVVSEPVKLDIEAVLNSGAICIYRKTKYCVMMSNSSFAWAHCIQGHHRSSLPTIGDPSPCIYLQQRLTAALGRRCVPTGNPGDSHPSATVCRRRGYPGG
jgi:hypothetical protein